MAQRTHDYDHLTPGLARYGDMAPTDSRRAALRDDLVAGFQPVARHIARRFARRGEPLDDLEQVASIGLLKALERFDPTRGRDFLSYAIPTITGEVKRYFRDYGWSVRTPRIIKERYLAVRSATNRLSVDLERAPTITEIADDLSLGRDEVAEAVAAQGSYQAASLDQELAADDEGAGGVLLDTLALTDTGLDHAETAAVLRGLVGALPTRERRMLFLRFFLDKTQSEIADDLGISQMHVSRLLARTFRLLRERIETTDHAADPENGSGQQQRCGGGVNPTGTGAGHR